MAEQPTKNPSAQEPTADQKAGAQASQLKYQARGESTAFSSDKYDVSSMSYPDNLLSDTREYGGNYVIFYINVSEDSKLLKDPKFAIVDDTTVIPPRQRGDTLAMNTSQSEFIGVTTAAGAGVGTAAKAAGVSDPLTGAALGAVGGAAIASQAGSFTRKQKRLKQAIALYVPEDLSIKYGMNWSEADMAAMAAVQVGADQVAKALGDKSGESNQGGQAMEAGKAAVANLALNSPGAGEFASVTTGLAANPKKEQVFKGVDFRTFSFQYRFFPRSSAEAASVLNIINSFKLHMHPEFKDAFNFLYIYPSEFDIYYYQNGKENMNLHRHTSCVLTDLTVNYTPNGIFTTFPDGMPTQINIQMTFKELALLTKDNILDGF